MITINATSLKRIIPLSMYLKLRMLSIFKYSVGKIKSQSRYIKWKLIPIKNWKEKVNSLVG